MKQTQDFYKSGGDALHLHHSASTFSNALTSQQDENWTKRGLKSCEECELYGGEECPYFEKYGADVDAVKCARKSFFVPDEQDKGSVREVTPVNPETKEPDHLPLVLWSIKKPSKNKNSIVSFWIALSATGEKWAVDTQESRRGGKGWLVDLSQSLDFLAYTADKARISGRGTDEHPPRIAFSTSDFLDFAGVPYTRKAGAVYTRRLLRGLGCLSCLCVKAGSWIAMGSLITVRHNERTNFFYITLLPDFFRLVRTAPKALSCPALDGLRTSDTALFVLGNKILERSSRDNDRKRGTAEALKVGTLLSYVSDFVSNRYNQKEKRRGWLEKKLDTLKTMGLFSRWYYTRAGQKEPLTAEEVKKLNLTEWKGCLIRWELDAKTLQLLEERSTELKEIRTKKLKERDEKKNDTGRKNA